jgi:hypothetical protein
MVVQACTPLFPGLDAVMLAPMATHPSSAKPQYFFATSCGLFDPNKLPADAQAPCHLHALELTLPINPALQWLACTSGRPTGIAQHGTE